MKKFVRSVAWPLAVALVVCGLLAAAAAVPGAAPAGGGRSALRFAWLSDLHIGSDRGEADLRASVADINTLPGLSSSS